MTEAETGTKAKANMEAKSETKVKAETERLHGDEADASFDMSSRQ